MPDMTIISDIDETGINRNLQVRYGRDQIYVSFPTIIDRCTVRRSEFQLTENFVDSPLPVLGAESYTMSLKTTNQGDPN